MRPVLLRLLALPLLLSPAMARAATLPPVIRGPHTVLLRAEAGSLHLKLYKRDLNIYEGPDTISGLLYDGQRRLVATLTVPDDGLARGQAAPDLQSAEATIAQAAAGVYRLQVTGSSDCVFGLQTSAAGCVVQGAMMLNDGAIGGRLLFAPPAEKFTITAQALHAPGQQLLPVREAKGQLLTTLDLSTQGVDRSYEVPAGDRRELWRLDIDKMDVKIALSKPVLWTLDTSAWFDAAQTKWLLLPYRQACYLAPAASATARFEVFNGTATTRSFVLSPAGAPELDLALEPAGTTVTVPPNARVTAQVRVRLGAQARAGTSYEATLTATAADDPAVAATAGLQVRTSPSPAAEPLALPIVLRRYEHENWQFGYAPDYEPNEVYFDRDNRPFMRQRSSGVYTSTGLQVLENGRWLDRPFTEALKAAYPDWRGAAYGAGGFLGAKVAFDGQNGAYTLLRLNLPGRSQSVLLYTPDAGRNYQIYPFKADAFDIEQFTGHNALDMPPPLLAYEFVKSHPAEFAGYHNLKLILPHQADGKLLLPEPILVAENCLGSCQHSGGPASTATRDGRTHIVWGEVAPTGTAQQAPPGVPEYIATYDHATGKLGTKVLLGYAPPVDDVHNVPAVCQDSRGYLHVVLGAHGQAFQYTRSLNPNDAYGGWTKPVPVLSAGVVDAKNPPPGRAGQTYISLVCDDQDTLHIAYRQWRQDVDAHHPGQIYAALSVQSKPDGRDWGPARPLVIPPVPGYSIYYHKLTVDRAGRLYLSYSYWADDETYQSDFPDRYHFRAVLTSADHGKTWRLLTDGNTTK